MAGTDQDKTTLPQPVDTIVFIQQVRSEELRKRWGWFLALGMLTIVLGVIAITYSVLATLTTVVFIGCLMMASGFAEGFVAFSVKTWGGFFLSLVMGILYVVGGFFIVANPGASAITLTLLIAMLFVFGGVSRIVFAIVERFPHWIWMLAHGIVNIILGIMIWRQWPVSGLWVIGAFVGFEMILNGWSLTMLGLAARKIPREYASL